MKPGRQLDKLIAEKIFEQSVVEHNSIGRLDWFTKNSDGSLTLVPQYSAHIASAWLIVEKMNLFNSYYLKEMDTPERDNEWFIFQDGGYGAIVEQCDTAPHAICLAALKLIGDEV